MQRSLFFAFAFALLAVGALHAQQRTFTDGFGRTLVAEIIAVEGANVVIRRDDGSVFTVPITTFVEEDQKAIAAWAAKQPKEEPKQELTFIPDPKQMVVGLSRGKQGTTSLYRYAGYSHSHEMWGYTIQVTNKHLRAVDKVRIEYNLFARTFPDISSPTVVTESKDFETVTPGNSIIFRTQGTEVCKRRDIYFGNNSGEMRGIWLRIYVDDKLLIDQSSPESLMTSDQWNDPKKAPQARAANSPHVIGY